MKKEIRQAAKPFGFVFHATWCPFPKTATCLCGKEPNYSPAAREARGEIPASGSDPHKISEGGSEEAALYWENRNKLKTTK